MTHGVKARCAYSNGDVRCIKPPHKGAFCKAHKPKEEKTFRFVCPSCDGVGIFYDEAMTSHCPVCHGRGRETLPLVLCRIQKEKRR